MFGTLFHSVYFRMALGLKLFRAFVLLTLYLLSHGLAQASNLDQRPEEQKLFDDIYGNQKTKTDTKSIPFCRFIQLYSRNSGRHVRIKEDRSVDASGEDGDKYAKLIIESVSFGRVHIRGSVTNFYLCVDKRGRLKARARGKWKDNCVFTDHLADNAFTEFRSVKYNKTLIAFNRSGRPRQVNRPFRAGMKAFQFIERALNIRLYKGRRYKISNGRGSNRIDLYRRKHAYDKIFVSYKKWKEFRRWLKLSKKKVTEKKNKPLTAAPEPRVQATVQLVSNNTASITLL